MTRLQWAASDSLVMTWRNLRRLGRMPHSLFFAMIQPLMFMLLFTFVFGGAFRVMVGPRFAEYLMAGVCTQAVAFGGVGTGMGLSDDLSTGIVDRFRSLPLARSAVLLGRTNADLVRIALTLVGVALIAVLLGWRAHNSPAEVVAGFGVLLLFGYSFSWIGVLIGLSVPNTEAAGTAGLVWLFPVVLISGAFVPPTQRMGGWLRVVAEWNPVTATAVASRKLFGNPNPVVKNVLPLEHPVAASVLWSLLLLAVFMLASLRAYGRTER